MSPSADKVVGSVQLLRKYVPLPNQGQILFIHVHEFHLQVTQKRPQEMITFVQMQIQSSSTVLYLGKSTLSVIDSRNRCQVENYCQM